jgi:purine nucleosidase
MARHFLIDTDTASDDAVALVMAMRYPDVQIEAITVVAGNVPVDQWVQNALYTVELCRRSIPVYRGMPAPLIRPLETAQFVHGQDGMGDVGLPLTGRSSASAQAVAVLLETIHQFAGAITLVALGPLTNVAAALRQDPSIAQAVSECIILMLSAEPRAAIPIGFDHIS